MYKARNRTFISHTSTIVNEKGRYLFCKCWEPTMSDTKALVFIAHDAFEHCLLYETLAKTLAINGFFVFAHDHVGHGQSGGSRVQIYTFDRLVNDVFQHVSMKKEKFPHLKCFIVGHGMGGTIAIRAALRRRGYFHGLALIAPAIILNPEHATFFATAAAKVLRWLVPQCPVKGQKLIEISSCPATIAAMKGDPLRYQGACKAAFFASMLSMCKIIQKEIPTMTFPFAIFHGESDKICDRKGALDMYEMAASHDKYLKVYPHAHHQLLYEPNGVAETVSAEIVQWLLNRV